MARRYCDAEVPSLMLSILAISLWLFPSNTYRLSTVRHPSGRRFISASRVSGSMLSMSLSWCSSASVSAWGLSSSCSKRVCWLTIFSYAPNPRFQRGQTIKFEARYRRQHSHEGVLHCVAHIVGVAQVAVAYSAHKAAEQAIQLLHRGSVAPCCSFCKLSCLFVRYVAHRFEKWGRQVRARCPR